MPPYVAVAVSLMSADGTGYELTIGGHRLVATAGHPATATLPGLRPGGAYRGAGVTISASAEPGP